MLKLISTTLCYYVLLNYYRVDDTDKVEHLLLDLQLLIFVLITDKLKGIHSEINFVYFFKDKTVGHCVGQ